MEPKLGLPTAAGLAGFPSGLRSIFVGTSKADLGLAPAPVAWGPPTRFFPCSALSSLAASVWCLSPSSQQLLLMGFQGIFNPSTALGLSDPSKLLRGAGSPVTFTSLPAFRQEGVFGTELPLCHAA